MSLPHMLTHPLGLPSGRTSRRSAASERASANNFGTYSPLCDARAAGPTRRNTSTEPSFGDRLAIGWRATVIDEHLGRKTRHGHESTDKRKGEPLVMC